MNYCTLSFIKILLILIHVIDEASATIETPSNPPSNTPWTNVALHKPTTQSSTGWGGVASRAVDENTNPYWSNQSLTHTNSESNPWWEVDLQFIYTIQSVSVRNRADCCSQRLNNFILELSTTYDGVSYSYQHNGAVGAGENVIIETGFVHASTIRIRLEGAERILTLAEVEANGCSSFEMPSIQPTRLPSLYPSKSPND